MAKGRNTTLLTTRIPDVMFEAIQGLAWSKGMTMSEYVRRTLEGNEGLQKEMEAIGQRFMHAETERD